MEERQLIIIQKDDLEVLLTELLERVVPQEEQEWVTEDVLMARLGLRSKTSVWNLRKKGLIEYTQPTKKNILYSSQSIKDYINKHKHSTF